MPIALDPSETYSYVFRTDRLKPEDQQPALIFNFPSIKQTRQIAKLFDASEETKLLDESLSLRLDAVRVALCGWKNIRDRQGSPIDYDPARLDEVLTDIDITELHKLLLKELIAGELEKKRSALFALSRREDSAKDAVPSDAAAPVPSSPPISNAPPAEATDAPPVEDAGSSS